MIRVAACQVRLNVEDVDDGWGRAVESAREAAVGGAQLIVLPELSTSGYVFRDSTEVSTAAVDASDDRFRELRAVSEAHRTVVVVGFAERADGGPYNSAVVLDEGRVLGVYRKGHLWDEEKRWFSPGESGPLLVRTHIGMVAVLICYDLEFPESVRRARESGADVIAAPVNWPLLDRPDDELPLEILKAQAFAGSYAIPLVIADRCGSERGVRWIGGSCVVARTGYLAARPSLDGDHEHTIFTDIEPAGQTRISSRNDVLTDRRPELYG